MIQFIVATGHFSALTLQLAYWVWACGQVVSGETPSSPPCTLGCQRNTLKQVLPALQELQPHREKRSSPDHILQESTVGDFHNSSKGRRVTWRGGSGLEGLIREKKRSPRDLRADTRRWRPRPTLTFRLGFAQDTQHLGVGGVLAQGPQHVPALPVGDLHLSSRRPVKQRESLFELCREKI